MQAHTVPTHVVLKIVRHLHVELVHDPTVDLGLGDDTEPVDV